MTTLHSQNGWRVLVREDLVWFTAAGQRFAAASADVATVAGYFIERFAAEVEPIKGKVLDDWSWAVRPVRGQTSGYSNHASATAWDLNATQHPRAVHWTFSNKEIQRIRAILADIKDAFGKRVIVWGGDFSTVVDSMHFEIRGGGVQVAQAAHIIRARQTEQAAAEQAQEDDVSFKDQHTLTAADVAAYGDPTLKVGDRKSFDEILRFPPAMARLRRELAARDAAQVTRDAQTAAQITALSQAVAALTATKPAPKP